MEQGAKINKLVPQETKPILDGVVEDLWNGAKRKREEGDSSVTAKRHKSPSRKKKTVGRVTTSLSL